MVMILQARLEISGFPTHAAPVTLDNHTEDGCLVFFSDSAVILSATPGIVPFLLRVESPYVLASHYVPAYHTPAVSLRTTTSPLAIGFPAGGGYGWLDTEAFSYSSADATGFFGVTRAQYDTQPVAAEVGFGQIYPSPIHWRGQRIRIIVNEEVLHEGIITGSPQMTPDGLIEVQYAGLDAALDWLPEYEQEEVRLLQGAHVFTDPASASLPPVTVSLAWSEADRWWATATGTLTPVAVNGVNYLYDDLTIRTATGVPYYRVINTFFIFNLANARYEPRKGVEFSLTASAGPWPIQAWETLPVWGEDIGGGSFRLYWEVLNAPSGWGGKWDGVINQTLTPEIGPGAFFVHMPHWMSFLEWERSINSVINPLINISVSTDGYGVVPVASVLPIIGCSFAPRGDRAFLYDYDPIASEDGGRPITRQTWRFADAWWSEGETRALLAGNPAPDTSYTLYPRSSEDAETFPVGQRFRVIAQVGTSAQWTIHPNMTTAETWAEIDGHRMGFYKLAYIANAAGPAALRILRSIAGESADMYDSLPFGAGVRPGNTREDSFFSAYDPQGVRQGHLFGPKVSNGPREVFDALVASTNSRLVQWRWPDGHALVLAPIRGTLPLAYDFDLAHRAVIYDFAVEAMPHRLTREASLRSVEYIADGEDEFTVRYTDKGVRNAPGESVRLHGVTPRGLERRTPLWLGQAASWVNAQGSPSVFVSFSCALEDALPIKGVGDRFFFRPPAHTVIGPDGQFLPNAHYHAVCESLQHDAENGLSYVEAQLFFTLASGWAPALRLNSDDLQTVGYVTPFGADAPLYFAPDDEVEILPRGEKEAGITRLIDAVDLGGGTITFSTALPSSYRGATVRHKSIIRPIVAGFAWFAEGWYYL